MADTVFLSHRASGRNWTALVVLVLVWLGLFLLWRVFQAAWPIPALLALTTLPAAWDFITARPAGLQITPQQVIWHSGRLQGRMAVDEISRVRLDTRLDLSVRVTLVSRFGAKVRLPQDAVPKIPALEAALDQAGLTHERHHFALFS